MTVRVGVIGTGIMGADHVTTLHRRVTGAAVTMVADLDLDRARDVAAGLPDVRATDDGFALIGDPTADGSRATPPTGGRASPTPTARCGGTPASGSCRVDRGPRGRGTRSAGRSAPLPDRSAVEVRVAR